MASKYARETVGAKICPELYALVAGEWNKKLLSTTDVVAIALGRYFKRPDLGYVVRIPKNDRKQKAGRPSQDAIKAARKLTFLRSFSAS